jgi:hypothetical protein
MRISARQRLALIASLVAWPTSACASEVTMSDDRFWTIIGQTTQFEADTDAQASALAEALTALPADEIIAFEAAFQRQANRAYTWDLWGAGYVAEGGMSDDGFEYFRRWLISKGRGVYEQVLAKPDDLADLLASDSEGPLEFEEFAYIAGEVWTSKTRQSLDAFHEQVGSTFPSGEPLGEPFEEDPAHLAARYPKLWQRFGDNPIDG